MDNQADGDEIYKKLVAEKLAQGGPFDFDGQNCHDLEDNECSGWDGVDRRCNCGNRRVGWVLSDDKTYIYAEAW